MVRKGLLWVMRDRLFSRYHGELGIGIPSDVSKQEFVFVCPLYRTLLHLDSELPALLQEGLGSQFDANGHLLVQGKSHWSR